jgi:glycosyltransferase involved in cell wall biosynthesis
LKTAIHQLTAGCAWRDAISNEAVLFRKIFRDWGYDAEIYCDPNNTARDRRGEIKDIHTIQNDLKPDDIVLLHLSIGSVANRIFKQLNCRKAILYHNITPEHYFQFTNPQIAANLKQGREQAAELAGVADLNMAVSQFNAEELEVFGYQDVKVLPIVIDTEMMTLPPTQKILQRRRDGLLNVIFVGRCSPNKKIEDALRAFAWLQRNITPLCRFTHIGSKAGNERYYAMLLAMCKEWQLTNVEFVGSVSQEDLHAYYKSADAFLCMSEHEGFCIPLLESMMHDVPIVAMADAAVPETMDQSGILLTERKCDIAAEAIYTLYQDPVFREAIIASQRDRLERYRSRNLQEELRTCLQDLLPVQ